jgi:hypothetical protein
MKVVKREGSVSSDLVTRSEILLKYKYYENWAGNVRH